VIIHKIREAMHQNVGLFFNEWGKFGANNFNKQGKTALSKL